jgi:hypothetical protein
VVGFGSSGKDDEVVWFAIKVLNCISPELPIIIVLDAVISYKVGVGEVEVPRWGSKEVNMGGIGKVCCKRE